MKYISLIISSLILLASCSIPPEEERLLKYEGSQAPKRTVLIEEFTGQKCVNCPAAHKLLSDYDEMYNTSETTGFITVSMHISQFGIAAPTGMYTPEVDHYAKGVQSAPSARINRCSDIVTSDRWLSILQREMERDTEITDFQLNADIEDGKIKIDGIVTALDNVKNDPHLQLWLVEDDVEKLQMLPNNGHDPKYKHHAVFRAAVNGVNGEPITLKRNNPATFAAEFPIADHLKPANLRIVAFVYTDADGVLQATQRKIMKN